MYVDLYTDSIFSDKIRVNDTTPFNAASAPSVSHLTIGGTTYDYFYNYLILRDISIAGTEIANPVTNPAGTFTGYKRYYLKGGNWIDIRAVYVANTGSGTGTWTVSVGARLYVGGYEIFTFGLTDSSVTYDPATRPADFAVRFCSIKYAGTTYYGICYGVTQGTYTNCGVISTNFFEQSIAPRYDGGAYGSDPQGGYGDNDTTNSATTRVSNPGGIIAGAGGHGLHVYQLDAAAVGELYKFLWSTNVADSIGRSIAKPMSGIISLHRMPTISGRSGTATSKLNVAGWSIAKDSGATWVAYEDSTNVFTIETDPIYVGTLQNDFADFAATSAAIHLPFCGTYPIDIKSIMGGYIRLVYVLDTVQGNCVCNVYTTCRNGLERLYGTYAGNCAYILPVSGSEQGAGQIAGIISTIAGAAALATATAPLAGAAGLVGGISAIGSGAVTQGNIGGNSAYYSHMLAELYIYRPKAVYPDKYAHQIGRPTGCAGTVGSYSGYLSGTVHADSIAAATEEERREIESTIAGGVFV